MFQNYFDQKEKYRLITEKVDNSLYPDAKYLVIADNINVIFVYW